MASSLIFSVLFVLSITRVDVQAQGLSNERPIVLSPEMYELFKPKPPPPNTNLCDSPHCSPMPLAANVHWPPAHGGRGLAANGIAGIPIVLIFGCLIIVGVYYMVFQRYINSQKAKLQQPGDIRYGVLNEMA